VRRTTILTTRLRAAAVPLLALTVLALTDGCGTNTSDQNHGPAASAPDGRILQAQSGSEPGQLVLSSPDGTNAQTLTDDDFLKGPVSWAPDGSRIAFTTYDVNRWVERLELIEPDGSGRTILCEACTTTFFVQRERECGIDSCSDPGAWPATGRLAWAPNGSEIAAAPAQGDTITLVDPRSGEASRLSAPGNVSGISWSPDSSALAVTINEPGLPGLYVIAARSGERTRLLPDIPYYAPPAWSPDGSTIAFPGLVRTGGGSKAQLVFVDAATGVARVVLGTDSFFEIYDLEWSPDGSELAVLHHPVDPPTAALLTIDDSGKHVAMVALCENVEDADGLCTTNGGEVSWSPDGDSLLFENDDAGRRGYISVELSTGQRTWLTSGEDPPGCCVAWQPT
jgi:Tol biopolymer transport system component